MDIEDKAQEVARGVSAMASAMHNDDELHTAMAGTLWKMHNALVAAGFKPAQALQIICSHGLNLNGNINYGES